jgi:hypothetical protein
MDLAPESRDVKFPVWSRSKNEPLWTVQVTYATCRVVDKDAFELKRVGVKLKHLSANAGAGGVRKFGLLET